ncbi:lamin tail domain-containing protein [Neolewinella agarilytica]|uniref:lamin tail domain-containing protein n=1 Tax=Neolewinella agarilytica TaxID=478744 RepID=UPI00235656BF|nr:lamin tail domain-containing protein [Neolewinella agarilytica]
MNKLYSASGAFTLLFFLLCTCVSAQTTQQLQSFEGSVDDNLAYSSSEVFAGSGGNPTWNIVGAGDLPNIPAASDGEMFFGVRNTGGDPYTLTFDAGEICELTSARFVLDYFAFGLDGADDIYFELVIDGIGQGQGSIIEGENSSNGGPISTTGWETFSVGIPGTAETAQLIITVDQRGEADNIGLDNVRVTATGTGGSCMAVCGVSVDDSSIGYDCQSFSEGSTDLVTANIPYSGAEMGSLVSVAGGVVGGDSPATQDGGIIKVSELTEGQTYTLEITGGDCSISVPFTIPVDQCTPSDLVINEVMAQPGSNLANDINGDGSVNSDDEFVEIYNRGVESIDVSGYTIEETANTGSRYIFPDGTVIGAGDGYVVISRDAPGARLAASLSCPMGVSNGFLGLNDNSPEAVFLKDPDGKVVAQVSFDDAPDGESLALSPDGNLDGGYQPHTTVSSTGEPSSPCQENINNSVSLPLELLSFTAATASKTVELNWMTAYELDNDRFELERSADGAAWEWLGTIEAGASVSNSYQFVDDSPLNGTNLYRLRQLDIDGTATIYGPVAANFLATGLDIYPNPTSGELRFRGSLDNVQRVSLMTSDGRYLRDLSLNTASVRMDDLRPGLYLLRVENKDGTDVLRFVKH